MIHNLDRKKDDDDGRGWNPFQHLEKTVVLQEARVFNETPLKPRACLRVLTKIIYLLNQGEHFGTTEATDAFFAMTRLFQSSDPTLRSMCYLTIKELADIAENVIIVTSSLTKDMTSKEAACRGPAIRALCRITDAAMLQDVERYMRQAIVDRVPSVASSALVTSLHMVRRTSCDVVKHWVNEAQEAASSDNVMVQYHALGLLYQLRRNDRLAVSKMLGKFTSAKGGLKSPFAYCVLIRIASKLLRETEGGGHDSPAFDFIESCLGHRNDMVVYEAASAIVHVPGCANKRLAPAVSRLQMFCSSTRAALRFAAVRTFNKVAMDHPSTVTACNHDLEKLITDSNCSVAMLAITTLLKTVRESGVDVLMKHASSFISESRSDEFKVVVVRAIGALCRKYPGKNAVMMDFLSNMLKDFGGFEYKQAIVDCIVGVVEENPECREAALAHLCEFIEDCDHMALSTKILHLLGKEGPLSPAPSKYIRYIFNRVVLESEPVRAAAVSALAKFGAQNDDLLPSVLVLLQRCMMDSDDEVRDRATFYMNVLKPKEGATRSERKTLSAAYISSGGLSLSIPELEKSLYQYTREPSEEPFDMRTVPLATAERMTGTASAAAATTSSKLSEKPTLLSSSCQDSYRQQLAGIPEFQALGPLFKSSEAVRLTEAETEYVVRCVKHTFSAHVVLQFRCDNTLGDRVLLNALVQTEPQTEGYEVLHCIPAASLSLGRPGSCYALVRLPEDDPAAAASCTFGCTLRYLERPCDPATGAPSDGGYEDEYMLEDLELTVADHFQGVLPKPDFQEAWNEVGECEFEREETFALASARTLDEAVGNIVGFLGMQPCEGSDKVPAKKNSHVLLLSGVFRGGHGVLVRARLALLADDGVTMQVTVRSGHETAVEVILASMG